MRSEVLLQSVGGKGSVSAILTDEVTLEMFLEAHAVWMPILKVAATKLQVAGESVPSHVRWDWRQKVRFLRRLECKFFAIECAGRLQGLMKTDLAGLNRSRMKATKGKELVYVDYLEVAPWNVPKYMKVLDRKAIYSRVGTRLMQAAVHLSTENELRGRVGLHSLPEAEDFYAAIGMTPWTRDRDKYNLRWFEFTPEAAHEFVQRIR